MKFEMLPRTRISVEDCKIVPCDCWDQTCDWMKPGRYLAQLAAASVPHCQIKVTVNWRKFNWHCWLNTKYGRLLLHWFLLSTHTWQTLRSRSRLRKQRHDRIDISPDMIPRWNRYIVHLKYFLFGRCDSNAHNGSAHYFTIKVSKQTDI